VVGHDVEDHPDPAVVSLDDQRLGLGHRAEPRLDVEVGDHVVACVGLWRRIPRVDPDRVHTEVGEMVQP
jgi:hypothetical protein